MTLRFGGGGGGGGASLPAIRASGLFRGATALTDHVLNPGTTVTNAGTFSRIKCKVMYSGMGIRLVYGNFYYSAGDNLGANPIYVVCSIESPSGTYFDAHFTGESVVSGVPGSRTATIQPGGFAVTEPIPVEVTAGQTLWVNTTIIPTSSGSYYSGVGVNYSLGEFSAPIATIGTSTDYTMTAYTGGYDGATGAAFTVGPMAVVGTAFVQPAKSLCIIGDSIAAGNGDSTVGVNGTYQNGYILRALNQTVPYVFLTRTGEKFSYLVGNGRRYRSALMDGHYAGICEYGRNDCGQGLTVIQGNAILLWTAMANRGMKVYQSTITCQTNSTDGWATTTNQTLQSSGAETDRLAFNAWLRAGAPMVTGAAVAIGTSGALTAGMSGHPLAGILDVCGAVESGFQSGLWKAAMSLPSFASAATLTSNAVTVTFSTAHGLPVGAGVPPNIKVVMSGNGSPFDGIFSLATVPTTTTMTYSVTASNQTAGAVGTAVLPYTPDGTHPQFQGATAMAALINTTTLLS